MKKLAILLAAAPAFALGACGSPEDDATDVTVIEDAEAPTVTETTVVEDGDPDSVTVSEDGVKVDVDSDGTRIEADSDGGSASMTVSD